MERLAAEKAERELAAAARRAVPRGIGRAGASSDRPVVDHDEGVRQVAILVGDQVGGDVVQALVRPEPRLAGWRVHDHLALVDVTGPTARRTVAVEPCVSGCERSR